MIKIEKYKIYGWEESIRGMRNPLNSWDRSDSRTCGSGDCDICMDFDDCPFDHNPAKLVVGPNDHDLMMRLRNAGPSDRKYLRFITVYVDVTAPLYWWKEFKTYRAGRKFSDPESDVMDPDLFEMDIETNSCSTMHKIHAKEFTMDDFSHEHLVEAVEDDRDGLYFCPANTLAFLIKGLNICREKYLETKDKKYWWQMIQLLPTSYNQKRTVMLNYEVLINMYKSRKNHKLDEWKDFCKWIETLPYSELITGVVKEESYEKKS